MAKTVPDTTGENSLWQRSVGQLGGAAWPRLSMPAQTIMKHRKLCAKSLMDHGRKAKPQSRLTPRPQRRLIPSLVAPATPWLAATTEPIEATRL